MFKHLLTILAITCTFSITSAQLTNKELDSLRRQEAIINKAIEDQFRNLSILQAVTGKVKNGAVLTLYQRHKVIQVMVENGTFYIEWEEVYGSEQMEDYSTFTYTANFSIKSLTKIESTVVRLTPFEAEGNPDHTTCEGLYLGTGNAKSFFVITKEYEFKNGIKKLLKEEGDDYNELFIPFQKIENCTDYSRNDRSERMVKLIRTFYDADEFYNPGKY